MADVAVVDYGMGNLRSVSKAIEHVAPALSVVVTMFLVPAVYLAIHGRREKSEPVAEGLA